MALKYTQTLKYALKICIKKQGKTGKLERTAIIIF